MKPRSIEDSSRLNRRGGVEAITAARFVIRELTQHYYLASPIYDAISTYLLKNPRAKQNAKMLAKLFAYRAPVSNSIARYLDVLGLDKRPPKNPNPRRNQRRDLEGSGKRTRNEKRRGGAT